MKNPKRRITFKVFISYLAIALLATLAGNIIFNEIKKLTKIENGRSQDTAKIIDIGEILTLLYEGESLGRLAIQSEDPKTLEEYSLKNEELQHKIDTLKEQVTTAKQKELLDSINLLINKKNKNISELRDIRNDNSSEASIQDALKIMVNLENHMGRLTIENFVENPDALTAKERKNWEEYIAILNKYNTSDSGPAKNDLKSIDSMILNSKQLLKKMHLKTTNQKKKIRQKEMELMENDLFVSKQLKNMLTELEYDIVKTAKEVNKNRSLVLKKSRQIITISAIIGVVLVILFSILILNDFWKAQHLREKLEAANKYSTSLLKSREHLISMVSHDLKTPLNTIIGYTELLSKNTTTPKETNYINHVKNASGFVAQLVDELLDYSKLEAGKIQIEKVPFKIVPLIKETALSVQSLNTKKNIELLFDIDENCQKTLIGDSYRVKQILYNLIGNAYKFTSSGSITVALSVTNINKQLHIAITDTGIGIAEEKQQLIFEEFQQADDDTVKKFGGSGLGLHISQKLATLMGGLLTVKSTLGEGSTFTLHLPAVFTNITPNEKENNTVTPVSNTPLTAVVIDDDETLLQLNEELLQNAGITTHTFGNGKKALEQLEHINYNFIITDIQLPEMNGFHFLETLQQMGITKPVIAVTGRKDMPEKFYTESGFAAILFKPYNPDKLIKTVNNLFANAISTNTATATATEKNTTLNFSLQSLSGFVGDNEEALKSVIKLYIEDTTKNVADINTYYQENNLQGISNLSHRMLTMLKQLEIKKETEILLELEKATQLTPKRIATLIKEFNTAITITLAQLEEYYSKP